jgi:hypothetical protein
MQFTNRWIAYAAFILALSLPRQSTPSLGAQQSSSWTHRGRVTVALVDTLPHGNTGYTAVILRSPGARGHDFILLPRATADGASLDAATRTLLQLRALHGDHPSTHNSKSFRMLTFGVHGKAARPEWAARQIPLAQRIVDRLVSVASPRREVPGYGRVPSLEFVPPALPVVAPRS